MNGSIDYAEMLEIPVNTLNVTKKRGKKRRGEAEDLKERALGSVNEKVAEAEGEQPRVAQEENVVDYGAPPDLPPEPAQEKPQPRFLENKLLLGEFIAVCALCATILLTNLFWQDSAINTFFRGLIAEETPAAAPDERSYAELTPGSVVSDADIECSVSEAGVLTFTGECSVYPPCDGVVESVAESGGAYTVEIRHTTSFSTVVAGLTYAYPAAGEAVYSTIPVGFTDGVSAVTVSLYDGDSLIRAYSLDEDNDIVWNV